MGLIGNILANDNDVSEFEKGLYNLGTIEVDKSVKMLNRVDKLHKVLLRGKDSYKDFLELLKELDAPKDYDSFFMFFVKSLYVDDDFYAIISIIEQNRKCFDGLHVNEVLNKISEEIYLDYVNK